MVALDNRPGPGVWGQAPLFSQESPYHRRMILVVQYNVPSNYA